MGIGLLPLLTFLRHEVGPSLRQCFQYRYFDLCQSNDSVIEKFKSSKKKLVTKEPGATRRTTVSRDRSKMPNEECKIQNVAFQLRKRHTITFEQTMKEDENDGSDGSGLGNILFDVKCSYKFMTR